MPARYREMDPYRLDRFVDAQRATYDSALAELRAGAKRGHWMWFVFPQIAGLGSSPTARRYAISGRGEARAYLAHPLLGARLRDASAAMGAAPGSSAQDVLGAIDAMKLRSSMTLFDAVSDAPDAGEDGVFARILSRWFDGRRDPRTLAILSRRG